MKISLRELRAGSGQKLSLQFNELLSDPQMVKPIVGDIFLSTSSATIKLQGHIETIVKLQCHSCLNYFFKPLQLELNEEFVYEDYLNGKALNPRDRELQREDFFESVPYDGEIDVSNVVFQSVTLAIPTYCSCGAECSGPPIYNVKAGENIKNVQNSDSSADRGWTDPRWHNLKTILPKDNLDEK